MIGYVGMGLLLITVLRPLFALDQNVGPLPHWRRPGRGRDGCHVLPLRAQGRRCPPAQRADLAHLGPAAIEPRQLRRDPCRQKPSRLRRHRRPASRPLRVLSCRLRPAPHAGWWALAVCALAWSACVLFLGVGAAPWPAAPLSSARPVTSSPSSPPSSAAPSSLSPSSPAGCAILLPPRPGTGRSMPTAAPFRRPRPTHQTPRHARRLRPHRRRRRRPHRRPPEGEISAGKGASAHPEVVGLASATAAVTISSGPNCSRVRSTSTPPGSRFHQ